MLDCFKSSALQNLVLCKTWASVFVGGELGSYLVKPFIETAKTEYRFIFDKKNQI